MNPNSVFTDYDMQTLHNSVRFIPSSQDYIRPLKEMNSHKLCSRPFSLFSWSTFLDIYQFNNTVQSENLF